VRAVEYAEDPREHGASPEDVTPAQGQATGPRTVSSRALSLPASHKNAAQ
jgi:hypothetical protein